jgi:hypothetical protein
MDRYGKYFFHKKLLKALLQRPLNLRRVNIFTTNNDLAFENAFDELGIHYIDGFIGHHKRAFRPEVYNYDLYFPGHTTEGQVRRVEKVIRYFKLHGSISWIDTEKSSEGPFGVEEKTIDYLRSNEGEQGKLLIYPSAKKAEYSLGFPYSELFRQFGLIKVEDYQDQRGAFPIVLVLEEAQNYIPDQDRKEDRFSISKKVFKRIAREGRKYGLSLAVASQRPSELSSTILSQCNSYIIHRLQNSRDQGYVKKLVSSANEDILNQLPVLPQQHAIITGDAVRRPGTD